MQGGAKNLQTTPIDKVAILLTLVGEENATTLLKSMAPGMVQSLAKSMIAISEVNHQAIHDALDHFIAAIRNGYGYDPKPYVETVLQQAVGVQNASTVMTRLAPDEPPRMTFLEWLDIETLVELVKNEHPQIIAVILTQLAPAVSALVIQQLPDGLQSEVVLRVATLKPVSAAALQELETMLRARLSLRPHAVPAEIGGPQQAAKIMGNLKRSTLKSLQTSIEERNQDIAGQIREQMFLFDDFDALDTKNMQALVRTIDGNLLALALKGTHDALRDKFLACMSQRAAQSVLDEMEARQSAKVSEVREAQKEIIQLAQRLEEDGTIVLRQGNIDDDS
jgi:flagellar motor switch protein FliG